MVVSEVSATDSGPLSLPAASVHSIMGAVRGAALPPPAMLNASRLIITRQVSATAPVSAATIDTAVQGRLTPVALHDTYAAASSATAAAPEHLQQHGGNANSAAVAVSVLEVVNNSMACARRMSFYCYQSVYYIC